MASTDKRDEDDIQILATEYLAHMEEKGYAPSTQNQFLKSLVFFLNESNKTGFDASDLWVDKSYRGSKKISHAQLLEIYRYCQRDQKLRNRALVLFLKDSGLRVSDVVKLNVGDYRETEKFRYEGSVYAWFNPQRTKKTKSDAYPCIGEESITGVSDYLDERGDPADNEPLFLNEEGRRMSRGNASVQFSRLRKTLENPRKISAHSCRKFHTTALLSAGMEKDYIHCLQGKTRSVYCTPYDDNTLREDYAKSYHKLRIFPYSDTDKEVQSLQQQVEALRRERDELKQIDEQRALEMQQEVKTMLDDLRAEFGQAIKKIQENPQ